MAYPVIPDDARSASIRNLEMRRAVQDNFEIPGSMLRIAPE